MKVIYERHESRSNCTVWLACVSGSLLFTKTMLYLFAWTDSIFNVGGEIVHHEQLLFLPRCFQKSSAVDESVIREGLTTPRLDVRCPFVSLAFAE